MALPVLAIASVAASLLSSLFGKKSEAKVQEDILNRRTPYTSSIWDPNKNPGLKTQMQLGPSNQFNWNALASRMTPGMMSLLETAAPQYQGYTTPGDWGKPGTGTGGANRAGSQPGNPFRPWQNLIQ